MILTLDGLSHMMTLAAIINIEHIGCWKDPFKKERQVGVKTLRAAFIVLKLTQGCETITTWYLVLPTFTIL